MPLALKWLRVPVNDPAMGASTDRVHDGSPILVAHKVVYGADGMPYQWKNSFRPVTPFSYGTTLVGGWLGDGGMVLHTPAAVNDVNANPSKLRYGLGPSKNYAIFKGTQGQPILFPVQGVRGAMGLNIAAFNSFDSLYGTNRPTLFNQPMMTNGVPTPPALVVVGGCNTDFNVHAQTAAGATFGYPQNDASIVAVTAKAVSQPASATMANGNVGFFLLYRNATNWYLAKTLADSSPPALDPTSDGGFNTTNVERYHVWGQYDTVAGVNSTQAVHATGTEGVYAASQAVEFFQGRVIMGNLGFYPKYVVIGDMATYVQKINRICWTILPNEKPSRGPFTTNSFGLTNLQFPWSIEVNNFADIDGVGNILQLVNMGDNQLVIFGDQGVSRLTGYLSTAVAGVNSSTYDVRPIMGAPPLRYPGAAVLTRRGIYYVGPNSIYLYDGNGVRDILYGSLKSHFETFSTFVAPASTLNLNTYAGLIDDDYIYFSNIGQGTGSTPSLHLLININNNKITTFGSNSLATALVTPLGSSKKNQTFNYIPSSVGNTGIVNLPSNQLRMPKRSVSFADSGGNQVTGSNYYDFWEPSGATGDPEKTIFAFRVAGEPGVGRRYVHAIINYGFQIVSGTPTATVRYLYGADHGWPSAFQATASTLGTLSAIAWAAGTPPGGDLPNQSQRLAFNETSFQNPNQAGTVTMGWSDGVTLIFEIDCTSGIGHFVLYSVDLSYIDRPMLGHVVMGAA